jgi:glycosyltransferase 2 family protein
MTGEWPNAGQNEMTSARRAFSVKYAIGVLQMLLTVAAFIAIALFWDTRSLLRNLANLSATAWLLALTICAAQIVLLVVRWREVVRALGFTARLRTLLAATLTERFVNQILPSTIGGDAARIGQLVADGVNTNAAALSVFFDRCLGILALVILTAASWPAVVGVAGSSEVTKPIGVIIVTALAGVSAIVGLPRRWLEQSAGRLRGTRLWALGALVERTHELFRTRAFASHALLAALAVQVSFCILFGIIGAAIAPESPWLSVAAFAPMIMLISLIPLSIGGWGVREGAAILLLAGAGIASEKALAMSVLFGITQLVAALLCGIVAALLSMIVTPNYKDPR